MNETSPQPPPEGSKTRSSERSRRSSRTVSHRHISRSQVRLFKLRLIVAVLSIIVIVLAVGWWLTTVHLAELSDKYYREQASIRKEENNLEALTARISSLEQQNAALVLGLIPGLQVLEYDKTLEIDREYLRNISFTLTGTLYSRNYEYRAVLQNDSLNIVQPAVTIYLFDERGVQIGEARLSRENATSRADSDNLQPNETRSYTGRVDLELDTEPKYFLITMD